MSVLENPVLIINKGWNPINACTVQKAISNVYAEKALIICPELDFQQFGIEDWFDLPVIDGEPFIQSVNKQIRVPEVIITRYNKIPVRKVVFSRRNLWKRDKFFCQYCGKKPSPDEISVDHVVPKHAGGKSTFSNCVLACMHCNKKKNNRTPEQAGMPLRRWVIKNGVQQIEYYSRPTAPAWNPIYTVKRYKKIPKSWAQFVSQSKEILAEMYWNIELED